MKILILSASPTRDLIVDQLLAEELQKKGHEVSIKPCLREGRQSVLEIKPDVVVMPPIRNPYSRDLAETIKHFGMGIVSRHTEPSCDWNDFKKIEDYRKHEILGQYPYYVDAEIVWGKDEAEILAKRPGAKFPVFACGAFTVDAYKRKDIIEQHRNRKEFCEKRNLDSKKLNLLICSPWGFADSAPDLHIEPLDEAKKDIEGRNRHFDMIRLLADKLKKNWNIIVSVHPGVIEEPYKKLCDEIGVCFDTETNSFDLKVNVEGIVHAGSTMAIGAHYLGIPAWQFGDINAKDVDSWWGDPESDISKVSPYFKEAKDLLKAIQKCKIESNANTETLAALEKGRYGLMDGQATKRAAEIVNKIRGKFTLRWPKSTKDYSQLRIRQNELYVITKMNCGICGEPFVFVNESFTRQMANHIMDILKSKVQGIEDKIVNEAIEQSLVIPHSPSCPHCCARFFLKERPMEQ